MAALRQVALDSYYSFKGERCLEVSLTAIWDSRCESVLPCCGPVAASAAEMSHVGASSPLCQPDGADESASPCPQRRISGRRKAGPTASRRGTRPQARLDVCEEAGRACHRVQRQGWPCLAPEFPGQRRQSRRRRRRRAELLAASLLFEVAVYSARKKQKVEWPQSAARIEAFHAGTPCSRASGARPRVLSQAGGPARRGSVSPEELLKRGRGRPAP